MPTYTYNPSRLSASSFPGCDNQPVCDPMPVCPVCGGLKTLCRPRFFAGQHLSEDDLNRLDRYITDKNRLHNRYLHGWGVVCGLEVVCSVCNPDGDRGKVVVKPGYALSPCGNDIVVSQAETVDLCEIIQRCRQADDPCLSPRAEVGCEDAEEDWILAVCYQEHTARDVVALRSSPSCNEGVRPAGQCGCNGEGAASGHKSYAPASGAASCGCNGQNAGTGTRQQTASGVNVSRAPQCEPTVVCEGYTFRAYRAPKLSDRKQAMGALVKRFVCCLMPFMEALGGLPAHDSTPQQLQQWLLNLKQALRDFLLREGLYDCQVAQKLAAVETPTISDEYTKTWTLATVNVLAIALLVLQKCLCAALLPPCPEPAMDDCVPIATVTMTRNPCRVIRICNVASRRFLLTWPNVHYWLSWIPLFGPATGATPPSTLRDLLLQLCCTTLGERFMVRGRESIGAFYRMQPKAAPFKAAELNKDAAKDQAGQSLFASLLSNALKEHPAGADLGTLLLAAMGAPDAQGNPLASDLELQHPGEFMLMNQLLTPMLKTTVPVSDLGTIRASADVAALREEVGALRELVKTQAAKLEKLSNARKPRK